jgi:hypothetical protein
VDAKQINSGSIGASIETARDIFSKNEKLRKLQKNQQIWAMGASLFFVFKATCLAR